MDIANIHEAKSQLLKLIDQAMSGEEVIIAKAGRPIPWATRPLSAPRWACGPCRTFQSHKPGAARRMTVLSKDFTWSFLLR